MGRSAMSPVLVVWLSLIVSLPLLKTSKDTSLRERWPLRQPWRVDRPGLAGAPRLCKTPRAVMANRREATRKTGTRPRIGLDARMVDVRESGLGRYARELVTRLPALDPGADYVVLKRPVLADRQLSAAPNVTEVVVDGWLDHPRNLVAARAIGKLDLDLYHALHHFVPPGLRGPKVVMTLHDLIWVEHGRLTFDEPWAFAKWRANHVYGTATMWHALRRSDHVVAISGHTRDRAVERFGLPRGRFTVVHHGVDHARFEGPGQATEPKGSYIFSLGNSKPYKNLPTLLRAFAVVLARHPHTDLVIAGRGDTLERLSALARKLGVLSRIHYTGMVDDAGIVELFRGARVLAFPSLIEGFGFPLIEAMAAGCPVVTSDIPVIEEIVGDAALRVDPTDHLALAGALLDVLSKPELRESLRERGRERARAFDWGRCARETLAVHDGVLGRER
jgi:glycosyltransferase involved in cell wall biosynthesis